MTVIPIVIGALLKSPNVWYKNWKTWKSEANWKQSKLKHCWEQPEYWEESWRRAETCYLSDSSGKPLANTGVKNSQISEKIIKIIQGQKEKKNDSLANAYQIYSKLQTY